jgi:hypothetical protein
VTIASSTIVIAVALELTMVHRVAAFGVEILGKAVEAIVRTLRTSGFNPTIKMMAMSRDWGSDGQTDDH